MVGVSGPGGHAVRCASGHRGCPLYTQVDDGYSGDVEGQHEPNQKITFRRYCSAEFSPSSLWRRQEGNTSFRTQKGTYLPVALGWHCAH